MITLDRKSRKVVTDCRTVGEFMTEAAALFGGHVLISVDGCRYEFHDRPKVKVTDDTPIKDVQWEGSGNVFINQEWIRIVTEPKPKTVKREGWVAVIDDPENGREMYGDIYDTLEAAKYHNCGCGYKIVGFAHVEWEEAGNE